MGDNKKKISIASSCFNEEENLREFYDRAIKAISKLPQYAYEIIIADNRSTDGSRDILRRIASEDRNFKVILNANNFGPLRSGYNAFLQTSGDAAILMGSDLQEPPELIVDLVRKWEEGYQVVLGVKSRSKENPLMFILRRFYYWLLSKFSKMDRVIQNFNGFGLYDRRFMNALKKYNEPIPYFRNLVSEIGFRQAEIIYVQPKRKHGRSKHNFFTLYDVAMTGFVNHSLLPLRLSTFCGFCLAGVSLLVSLGYLVYKLLYWETFSLGIAPLTIGLFFLFSMQLIFIGIVGEYIGAILMQVKNYPLVIEDEKLNF
ncbi:MAG: glycosyltransferase family 2 protein [Candidatus Omnitrophica bacterium]|nr:glycosyltransferase family 2 protein [Candidatus Omnitrophota bacterium]